MRPSQWYLYLTGMFFLIVVLLVCTLSQVHHHLAPSIPSKKDIGVWRNGSTGMGAVLAHVPNLIPAEGISNKC